MALIRIEEATISMNEEFTKDKWIEDDEHKYGDIMHYEGNYWIVVEVKENV